MNYPAASYGVSKTARNEASFGEYDPERLKKYVIESMHYIKEFGKRGGTAPEYFA
jgi:hypothetical protein